MTDVKLFFVTKALPDKAITGIAVSLFLNKAKAGHTKRAITLHLLLSHKDLMFAVVFS